ncbi:2-dehydropantoate 2-reductase [Paraburkholderia bengalensis]|uniref:ketopantoate reductase family protein n=1 Tax=Paraburkholderia bengalensis TaxID=2747562 RepID=UPI003014DE0B
MKIAVIGSGGVGGFYGLKLVKTGHDVTFVARGAHLQAMQESGLRIENDLGNNSFAKVKATDDITSLDKPDLIIIAVKMWDLEAIAHDLKKIAGPNTAVLSLQNGVIKDYVLRRVFGEANVIGGVGYVATSIGRPGVIKQVGALQRIKLGEYDGQKRARTEELVRSFADSGIEATLSDNIARVLWEKFVFLVGLSSMTCLTHLTIGPIRESEGSRGVLRSVIAEGVSVGRAHGISLPEDYADQCMDLVDNLPYTMTSSMFHDLEKGNRIELPWLGGGVVSLAREVDVPVPVNTVITDALSPYVNGRTKG